jgi:hypothetical protein
MLASSNEQEDLVAYLVRSTRLSRSEALRLVDEMLAFLDDLPEDFVRRRHRELQNAGRPNSEIFARIAIELEGWRFRAPTYTPRQLRRMIYG